MRKFVRHGFEVGTSFALIAACSGDSSDPPKTTSTRPEVTTTEPAQSAGPLTSVDATVRCAKGEVSGVWVETGETSSFAPFEIISDDGRQALVNVMLSEVEVESLSGIDVGCGINTKGDLAVNCRGPVDPGVIATHSVFEDGAARIFLDVQCNDASMVQPGEGTVVLAATIG